MIFTNHYNLPDRVIKQLSLPHKPVLGRLGVTALLDSPLINHLRLKHWDSIKVDYSDFLTPMLGISVHERQERLAEDDEVHEEKLETVLNGITIVGKSDNVQDGVIRDTKVSNVGFLRFKYDDLVLQLNLYAWLNRIHRRKIKALEGDLYYKNWSLNEVAYPRAGQSYPPILYENVKVPLWTFEKQQQEAEALVHYHQMATEAECSPKHKWCGDPAWCVVSTKSNTSKSMRNLNSKEEAEQWIKDNHKTNVEIVERFGGPRRCQMYCEMAKNRLCPYYKGKVLINGEWR